MNIEHLSLTISKCLVAILNNTENLLYCYTLDSSEYRLGWNEVFKGEASTYPEASLYQCEAKVVSEALEETHLKLLYQNIIILLDQDQKKILLLDAFQVVQQKRNLC